MIKPRVYLIKSRYFILFVIICLLLWQIIVKYPAYISQTKDGSGSDSVSKIFLIISYQLLLIFFPWLQFISSIKSQANKSRVMVSVYYEALCPDSRSFFVRHLLPVFEKMSSGLEVELIPYGKAEVL